MNKIYNILQKFVQLTYLMLSVVFTTLMVILIENDLRVPTWLCIVYIITTALTIGKIIYKDFKKMEEK